MDDDKPFGHDTLKLRAVFVPQGNPDKISKAPIAAALGYDALEIPAVLVPDGSDIPVPGYPFKYFGRYVWRADGGIDMVEPAPDGGSAAGPATGAGYGGDDRPRTPAAPVMPPTPTPAVAPRYVDPAKAAVATWRASNMLSPRAQPVASSATKGLGKTGTRPNATPGETAGSSELYAYVANDPLNKTDPSGLCAQAGCGNADPSTQLIAATTAGAATTATALAQAVGSNVTAQQLVATPQSSQPIGVSSGGSLPLGAYQQMAAANTGVQSDATTAAVQPVNYYTSDINNSTASALGMTRNQLRAAIHSLKGAVGLGGADNVQIHIPSGEVFFNGESIGNLNDE